ncbi:MAG: iron ABC transporter permease [Deltaproteobacteria bacterium]|nr:iron ABC transporter permease [Deltaproteobacteria bacterium]
MIATRLTRRGYVLLLSAGLLGTLLAAVVSLGAGPADRPLFAALEILLGPVLGLSHAPSETVFAQIVWDIRLPRILSALLVGGALAIIGTTLQAIMRNPLADPYILGISSGAAVGAALAAGLGSWLLSGGVGGWMKFFGARAVGASGAAFVTALVSVLIVYSVASVEGRITPVRLLLAGVAYSAFASALTAFILYLLPDAAAVRGVIFWLLGGLSNVDWTGLGWMSVAVVPSLLVLGMASRWMNLLLLGDDSALSLGLDVAKARLGLILVTALATGAIVAEVGAVGFVGLIVPHAVRPLTGPDHRRLMPVVFIFGAGLLVAMDGLSRTILAPQEIPVGILTGLLGAPFFLFLLRRSRG